MLPVDAYSILTRDEVAEWLKVHPRQVERLGVPQLDLGRKTKRYYAKDILEWLDAKRAGGRTGTQNCGRLKTVVVRKAATPPQRLTFFRPRVSKPWQSTTKQSAGGDTSSQ